MLKRAPKGARTKFFLLKGNSGAGFCAVRRSGNLRDTVIQKPESRHESVLCYKGPADGGTVNRTAREVSLDKCDCSQICPVVKQPGEGKGGIIPRTKIKDSSYHGFSGEKIFLKRKIFFRTLRRVLWKNCFDAVSTKYFNCPNCLF